MIANAAWIPGEVVTGVAIGTPWSAAVLLMACRQNARIVGFMSAATSAGRVHRERRPVSPVQKMCTTEAQFTRKITEWAAFIKTIRVATVFVHISITQVRSCSST